MKKILIIEDDKILLETAADFLREEGYFVYKAQDGDAGIELAERYLPDLILCDILMPGTDGYQVHKRLKCSIPANQIPFIFMSAKATYDDVATGLEMGADDYITKPIDFIHLRRLIRLRLDKSPVSIRRSESTYYALFEMNHDAIFVLRPEDGTILDVNRATCETLGFPKQELTGRLISTFFGGNYPLAEVLHVDHNGKPQPFSDLEISLLNNHRQTMPVQMSGTPFEIEGERLYTLIARNLSHLRKAEQDLKRSDARYSELVEKIGEGVGLVDGNENFLYANPAAGKIFGLPPEELIGKSLWSFLDPAFAEEIKYQTSIRKEGQNSVYELEIIRHDGTKRWIMVTANPQFDPDNQFVGTSGIFRDITEQRDAEMKMRESEKRFREIVDLTNDWIWEITPEWKYRYVSPKVHQILGWAQEEMVGHSPFEFLPPEDLEFLMTDLRKLVHAYLPINALQTRVRHKDGRYIYLETSGVPIFDEMGNYAGYRGADREITLRKEYEKELIVAKERAEESDRLKSSILANISHELRTPLNGILGFSEILREELADSEYFHMVDNIFVSGKRLMATLNAIITLSQLEAGKIKLSMKECDLAQAILSVSKSMETMAKEKKIEFNTLRVNPVPIVTDEQMFKQLLRQIVDNAIKFTDFGAITFETRTAKEKRKNYVVVSVRDTGIGIDKDYFDLIFQEFRQVSEGFGRKYQGSGIGLTISKKIIDLLGGMITVESEEGKGSCFHIWLPADSPETEKTVDPLPYGDTSPENGKQRIERQTLLIVEDNKINSELIEKLLRPWFTLHHASTGVEALEKVKSHHYDMILMDINLGPGLTGLDVAKEVRKTYSPEILPMIAITGYATDPELEKIMESGFNDCITKPFSKTGLLTALEKILKRHF